MVVISAITFGGGSQPLFEDLAVHHTHLLTLADFSSILAFGYATPGPAVFGTATFIGFRAYGLLGALVGTVAIFTLPWLLAMVAARYLGVFSHNRYMKYFSQGVALAAAGLLISTAWIIGKQSTWGIGAWAIFVLAFSASVRKINPLFILGSGLFIGLIIRMFN